MEQYAQHPAGGTGREQQPLGELVCRRAKPAVVRDGSFLGVVAEREEQAVKARGALIRTAKWSGGFELPDPARLHEQLMALPTQSSVVSQKQGVVPPAAKTLEAKYTRPYIAHASIGPSCAVADLQSMGRYTQAFGRLADQQRVRLCAGEPERGAAMFDRLAP